MSTVEPPMLNVPQRPAAAGRVAFGLLAFSLLDIAYFAASIVYVIAAVRRDSEASFSLSAPGTFIVLWVCAWCVWRDKRIVWPIIGYLSTLALGSLLGMALTASAYVPLRLLRALSGNNDWWFTTTLVYSILTIAFLAWLAIEAHRVDWGPALRRPRWRLLRPTAFGLYGGIFSAAIVAGILSLLTGPWTQPIIDRAKKQLGPEYANYDYYVSSFSSKSTNGQTKSQAVVMVYSDTEINWIKLNWEDGK